VESERSAKLPRVSASIAYFDRLNVAAICHSSLMCSVAGPVEAVMTYKLDRGERAFLEKRLRQETEAALNASDARAAAAHVSLANQYLQQLNGRAGAGRGD
jgi:hypothetical protein